MRKNAAGPKKEMAARWIDISVPLRAGMVHWPGDPPIQIRKIREIRRGHSSDLSFLSMGSHTGTHMDAPGHFLRGGATLDELSFSTVVGPARVIGIRDPQQVCVKELRRHGIRRGERILLKTRNSSQCWKGNSFRKEFVHLREAAARFLAARGVRCVGVDYLSVGGYKRDGAQVHRLLLRAGIWILEGLNLSRVRPGRYELICLPLKIWRGDGAPARAILRPIERSN